jgi:cell division septum initiation protein DivIVA
MGGYDIQEVDKLVSMVESARESTAEAGRASVIEVLRSRQREMFRRRFRGYSKIQVYNYVNQQLREFS